MGEKIDMKGPLSTEATLDSMRYRPLKEMIRYLEKGQTGHVKKPTPQLIIDPYGPPVRHSEENDLQYKGFSEYVKYMNREHSV